MRILTILLLTIFISCSTKWSDRNVSDKLDLVKASIVTDSCLDKIFIDEHSVETKTFKKFWNQVEKLGYIFKDDTIVPFVKVIFQPKSSEFYNDTLKISSCSILDSVNIHRIEIRSSKPVNKEYYPNLNVEEWQFKSALAASGYANALADYHQKGFGLKSPTAVLLTNHSVYIFETAAYMSIPNMEQLEKLLDPNAKVYSTNY